MSGRGTEHSKRSICNLPPKKFGKPNLTAEYVDRLHSVKEA